MNEKLYSLLNEFFSILETKEETDSGKDFYPVQITSCRVLKTKRLGEIFSEIKEIMKENEK